MKVILAKTAGFCMGVRRAMNAVIDATRQPRSRIYTLGPLVHNNQAVEMLRARDVRAVADPSEVAEGTLFIRAHGVTPDVRRACERDGVTVCDLTCPHVRRAQKTIERHAAEGFDTIIAGDENHAEVVGLLGHAMGRGHVVGSADDVGRLPPLKKVCLVAQTTQSAERFHAIAGAVAGRFPGAVIHNTICSATDDRQNEVRELSRRVDAMIVVGGQHSANTVRLAEIARGEGVPTLHIETERDLLPEAVSGYGTIGVTAGASTPHWVFQAVVDKIGNISRARSRLGRILAPPFGVAVYTYLFLGAGSAATTYAALRFLGIEPRISYLLLSFMYVVSMHTLNRFTDRAAAEINDPLRMDLFRRIGPLLIGVSLAFAAGAFALAAAFGAIPAVLMGASLLAGIGYNVPILPRRVRRALGFTRVKEIPGSKDLGPAAAWAVVAVLLPCLAAGEELSLSVLGAVLFAFLMVFVRFLIFDLKDLEGDRLVGNETLPLILGKHRTGRLLFASVAGLAALVLLAALGAPAATHPAVPAAAAAYAGASAFFHFRRLPTSRGVGFEMIVDFQFILLGLLAWLFR